MENLADISDPQVASNEQKDQKIHFSICLLIFLLILWNLRFWNICQVFHTGLKT